MIYISLSYTYGYHLADFGHNGFIYTTFSILPTLYHRLQISALLLPSCFCHCFPPLWKKRINILLSSAVRVLLWKVALTADVWKVLKQVIIQPEMAMNISIHCPGNKSIYSLSGCYLNVALKWNRYPAFVCCYHLRRL